MTEAEFLARVRAARQRPSLHWTHDRPELGAPAAPPIAEPVAHYLQRAEAANLHPVRVATLVEAADKVVAILAGRHVKKLIRAVDSLLDELDLDRRLGAAGVTVTRYGDIRSPAEAKPIAFAADAGLGTADLAVAETGSLLIGSSVGRGRGVSLNPKLFISVLPVQRIVPRLSDALAFVGARLRERGGGQHLFLSNASSTGDIESRRVVGVHGPEFVHVILIG